MNTRDLDIHVGLEALLDPPGVGGDPLQVLQLLIVRPHHHALFSATMKFVFSDSLLQIWTFYDRIIRL